MRSGLGTSVVDVAAVPIAENDNDDKFARFVGGIRAAERLGYNVRVDTVRDPSGRVHSLVARVTGARCQG